MKNIDRDKRECHAEFGEFIRSVRLKEGLYQSDLAAKLDVSQTLISMIEKGERDVDLSDAMKICKSLNVDLRDFLDLYNK